MTFISALSDVYRAIVLPPEKQEAPELEKKIIGYLHFEKGWYFGEGIPASQQTVDKALDIARYAHSLFFDVDSTLSVAGEIRVAISLIPAQEYISALISPHEKTYGFIYYKKSGVNWKRSKRIELDSIEEIKEHVGKFFLEHEAKTPCTLEFYPNHPILKMRTVSMPVLSQSSAVVFR